MGPNQGQIAIFQEAQKSDLNAPIEPNRNISINKKCGLNALDTNRGQSQYFNKQKAVLNALCPNRG